MESSSTCAYLPLTEDLFGNEAWLNPAIREENMLPCSAFASTLTFDCVGLMGIPQHALTNADLRSWFDKNSFYVSSHGLPSNLDPLLLSKDSKPLPSHGQSYVEQMMASLTGNGSVDEVVCANSSMRTTQMLPKLGSFTHTGGLTVDPCKVGIHVCQDVHALSMDPKLTERAAANLSCLGNQASFTSSTQLAQVAADSLLGNGGKLASPSSESREAGSQENLTKLPSGLRTLDEPICTGTNIAKGCHLGLQGAAKQTARVSPTTYATSRIKEEPTSMDNSDENISQEAFSLCDTNGRCDITTESVNKGKKRRFKDRLMDDAAQLSNVKSTESDGDKEGKRHKSGGETSEEDQKKAKAGNSTPSLGIESSKPPEPSKPDYIHVRARRGQATDSHSLAERVRRKKISEKMKLLQGLVPGCSKVTGKALMLDEIINYVQSLQRQVEFLSLKLASLNPVFDFHLDGLFARESTSSYRSLRGLDMAGRQASSAPLVSMDSMGM